MKKFNLKEKLMFLAKKIIPFILKNKFWFIFGTIFALLAMIEVFFFFKINKSKTSPINPQGTFPLEENIIPTDVPRTDNSLNILLLGYGGAGHDGGALTDSIILLNINPETKRANVISIPRDLWVPVPTDFNNQTLQKINAAYAIGMDNTKFPNKKPEFKGEKGGGNLAKYVVEKVTGIPVDYFISVDFSRFASIIDTLGGIDINVPVTFTDNFYPVKGLENETCGFSAEEIANFHSKYSGFDLEKQFTCRYEKLHFEKGINHLDGATTLKFVRSRHSNESGGDFARSERQHAVLTVLKEKILTGQILNKANPIFKKLAASIKTDIDTPLLDKILEALGNPGNYKVNHIYITDQNVLTDAKSDSGAFILIPKAGNGNFSELQNYIKQELIK